MKKYFNLLFIPLILISCETKVEAEKFAGEWLMEGDRFGLGYSAGDQKDADFVMKFMNAYSNKNAELMVEMSADTVKFHPADMPGVYDVDMTNSDFILERQSEWDSINRDYVFIMPQNLEDSERRVITTAFNEKRYIKDGTVESINFYERLYINADNKISRVVQYSRLPNE
tara:strand:+ start:1586 stop:2098 length:513 start_codon:yes stop_codon:yes gene_type:complete